MVFLVLDPGVGRMRGLLKDADFEAFERGVKETAEQWRTCFEIRHVLTPTLCPVQVEPSIAEAYDQPSRSVLPAAIRRILETPVCAH